MNKQNYTTTFTVAQSPEEVFVAINNPQGWWSEEIEGQTDKPGAEFTYHYQDVHRCTFKITEFLLGKKVVWHVLANRFNFTKDKSEWTGTDVVFEIIPKGGKTAVRFTHVGLVPDYECFAVCSDAWGTYIKRSLRDLITTGKGQPNPIESVVAKAREMSDQSYATSFTVDQSPDEVFAAVNNVRGWWSTEIEGSTDRLGAEFVFHFQDLHRTTQRITEWVPGRKVVWEVVTSHINFVEDRNEWKGTRLVFEITPKGRQTELRFTHDGLAPASECYENCSSAWKFYINESLRKLVTTGKGEPAEKEEVRGRSLSAM